MIKLKLRLKDKILISILPVIIISLILISTIAYSFARYLLLDNYQKQKEQVAANVIETVNIIDSGYRMLERSLEEELSAEILEFKAVFEAEMKANNGDIDKISLDRIKEEIGSKHDLIVIDQDTTIIKSTLSEGLNFNFREFDPELGTTINYFRLSDDIKHERIRTNVGTGYLSKFTYLSAEDHQYVLETVFSMGSMGTSVVDLDPLKAMQQLEKNSSIVSRIRLFDVYGYEFVNSGENYQPTTESLDIVAKVKDKFNYSEKGSRYEKRFIYINLAEDRSMTDNSKIVEIEFDKTAVIASLDYLFYLIYSLCMVVVLIIVLLVFYLSKRITRPITLLSGLAKKVAAGVYEISRSKVSNDEIGVLTDIFYKMIDDIKYNFEKIENQKNEMEHYSRNLESMVKERTLDLLSTLEESKNTQELLQVSNVQFENLFHNMQEGFAIHEMILNDTGKPVDYRILDANKAFVGMTKITDYTNKTYKEIYPCASQEFFERCALVAMTGKPDYYDDYETPEGKHLSIHIFSPAKGKFATLLSDTTSQFLSREEIRKEKQILEYILDDVMSGYWDWNLESNSEYLSPGFKKMLGYEDHELENSPYTWQRLIFKEDLAIVFDSFKKHVESFGVIPFYNQVRYTKKDGSTLWVICAGRVIEWTPDMQPKQMIGCHIDITHLKRLEKSLSDERELLKATLLSMGDGVITTDKDGKIVIMNEEAEDLTGWKLSEAMGKPLEEIFYIIDEFTRIKCENPIDQIYRAGDTVQLSDHTLLITKDGLERPIEDSAAPIRDEEGKYNGAVLIFRDFTEKKEKQAKIEYLSYHDQLTGLYNRRFLEAELKKLDIPQNHPLSVVMVDVNGLKLINDAFGHNVGDMVLQRTAQIMEAECRKEDLIARFGGDEFVLIMPKTHSTDVEQILKHMVTTLITEEVGSIHLSVSYGWSTKQTEDEKISDVFKKAEDHMYRRKLSESKSMRYKTVEIILKTLHEKSEREKIHSERVSQLCEAIGIAMDLEAEDIRELKTSGLMHDIGKIAIDLSILDKPDKLNQTERIEIERHPELGYQILRSINEFAKMAEYVLSHHERWDGTGYPGKLKGEEIPLEARIITLADAYHAMTSDRPYRKALSKEAAIEEIKKFAGIQFDPYIAKLFVEKVLK